MDPMSSPGLTAAAWADKLGKFVDGWKCSQPALAAIADDLDVVFHGSAAAGVDDAWSDLDLWGFVSEESLQKADALSPTRFYEFTLEGKPGHLNLETRDEAMGRVRGCDLTRICELRRAQVLVDRSGFAPELIALANKPMSAEVRRVWAMYHYIEMRSEHRACDTPIERGDATALFLAVGPMISQALRCAMVIDGEPYPYSKWLGKYASQTPTGAKVYAKAQEILDVLAADGLRQPGPEKQHPVSLKAREIRAILVEAARSSGLDEPWLAQWWLWMTQARDAIARTRWS